MERSHLIIIALILVALYMMNKDTKDTVMSMGPVGPMARIRYNDPLLPSSDVTEPPGPVSDYIRTRREGFEAGNEFGGGPFRIRYSDKSFAHSQHIKNHIRNRNMNSMFSGMVGGCGTPMKSIEKFGIDCELTPDLC
jgi:hypothetical protein